MPLKELTWKQKKFCAEYLSNGNNATKAAISAQYSKHTAYSIGNELLKKPEIKMYMKDNLEEAAKRCGFNADNIFTKIVNGMNVAEADKEHSAVVNFIKAGTDLLGIGKEDKKVQVTATVNSDTLDELLEECKLKEY